MNKLIDLISYPPKARITILLFAIFIYANTVPNKWALDDGLVIHENQLVRKGISGVPSIISHDFIYGYLGENTNSVAGGRYRPLTVVMYACLAEVFGKPQINPVTGKVEKDKNGHILLDLSEHTIFPNLMHIVNILLYAILCLVLYHFLCLIFKQVKSGLLIAYISAFIFTIHPIHTEVVANVKGSDEILSLLFSLSAAICFFQYFTKNQGKKALQLFIGVLFLFLALLSKENSVVFIVIIPLTLWFFSKVKLTQIAFAGCLLLLPFAGYMLLRTNALNKTSFETGKAKPELMNNPFLVLDAGAQFSPLIPGSDIMVLQNYNDKTFTEMPALNKLATNVYTFGKYLTLLVLPYPLTYDYYPRQIAVKSFADPAVLFSLLINLGLLLFAVFKIKEKQVYSFGILFYFITFALVSNMFFPIGTNMAERFMFMPSVGAFIAMAYLLVLLLDKIGKSSFTILFSAFILCFCVLTFQRNLNWKDNFTLFSHDLEVSDNSAKVKSDYGEVVLLRIDQMAARQTAEQREETVTEREEKVNMLQNAFIHYKEALHINPTYGVAWQNLGRTAQMLGQQESFDADTRLNYLKTAISAYNPAQSYSPARNAAPLSRVKSLAYTELGKLYGQNLNNLDSAFKYLHLAIKLNPENAYANLLMGTAYAIKNDIVTAYEYTTRAYQLDPLNRYCQENYALLTQRMVATNNLDKSKLLQAENLLLRIREINNSMPDDNAQKPLLTKRTLEYLLENYQLQGKTKSAEDVSKLIQGLN